MPKFSIEIGVSLDSLESVSTKAEELNFDGIFYGDSLSSYQLECWTAIAIISSYTEVIRVGPAVTFPLIRHPSVLARTAATIDQFSNGRLEFRVGLGGKTMKLVCPNKHKFTRKAQDFRKIRYTKCNECKIKMIIKNDK